MPDSHPYRMRDLVRLTGLPPATINFYATSGLLPDPVKTGRTQQRYRSETVARLRWIRALQQELGLSLRAIRDVLEREGELPVAQVRTRVALGEIVAGLAAATPPPAARARTSRRDAARLTREGVKVTPRLLEIVSALQRAGFDETNGFSMTTIADYRRAVGRLIRTELHHMLGPTLKRLGPERTGELLVRGLPLVDELLTYFHHEAFVDEFRTWTDLAAERAGAPRRGASA